MPAVSPLIALMVAALHAPVSLPASDCRIREGVSPDDQPLPELALQKALAIGAPGYFRTYLQMTAAMQALAAAHPNLVSLEDIGDSWEKTQGRADRDIWMLRIGRRAGPRPKVVYLGGLHAREIAPPEVLMRWAKQLVEGYGSSPLETALLDTRELLLVPVANPDGHAVVERGYAIGNHQLLDQRKNTSGIDGVDLNRNFNHLWGMAGSSTDPRSDIYRGSAAASEPEVQAMQALVIREQPAAVLDSHSSGDLIMRPWAHSCEVPPDHVGLRAIGDHISGIAGLRSIQAIELYPTSGTSRDWAYGALGIPAFTEELGQSFHQDDAEFEDTFSRASQALRFMAAIADLPYERAAGPTVVLRSANGGQVDAAVSGPRPIAAAEAVLDPLAAPGTGVPLTAADGAFDSDREDLTGAVPMPPDRALVHVRGRDVQGNWGPLTAAWIP